MTRGRQLFSPLILSALGLLALICPNAHAGEWLIEGKTLGERGLLSETVTGEGEGLTKFHVLKLEVVIECEKLELTSASISQAGHMTAFLKMDQCKALDLKGNELLCSFIVTTSQALGQVISHGFSTYILFTQKFMQIVTVGGFCPLPEEVAITGAVVFKIDKNNANPMLVSAIPTGLFSDFLKYGTHITHFSAAINLRLTGANAGKTLGAH